MNNPPERIFLQVGPGADGSIDFNDLREVTWNSERVFDTDLEYQLIGARRWKVTGYSKPGNGPNQTKVVNFWQEAYDLAEELRVTKKFRNVMFWELKTKSKNLTNKPGTGN